MKRTAIVLGVIVCFTWVFLAATGLSLSGGTNSPCCNVTFVVHKNNMPLSNVTVTVPGTGGGTCTTGPDGKCTICISGSRGQTLTANTSCGASRKFEACSTPVEIIDCFNTTN